MSGIAHFGRGDNRARALAQPRVLIALTIPGCVMVWGASQLRRNVYEAAHVLPTLVLFCMLCLMLQSDTLPLHRPGVPEVWNGSITDPVDYLRRHNSDRALVGCRYLPPAMRAGAARAWQSLRHFARQPGPAG